MAPLCRTPHQLQERKLHGKQIAHRNIPLRITNRVVIVAASSAILLVSGLAEVLLAELCGRSSPLQLVHPSQSGYHFNVNIGNTGVCPVSGALLQPQQVRDDPHTVHLGRSARLRFPPGAPVPPLQVKHL